MRKLFPYLTYGGAIPFVFCAICLAVGIKQLPILGSVENLLSAYALVISTFLAGAHWGQHLHIQNDRWAHILPILSNVTVVLLWVGFLVLSFKLNMFMFVAAFGVLLMVDHRLYAAGFIARDYFKTRMIVSSIVIITLIASGIFA